MATGTGWWYHPGFEPLPIRWVLSREPEGGLGPRVWFSTEPDDTGPAIVAEFVRRWSLEAIFEETQAHLGVETQRQWSDLAIARQTPCHFGLCSLATAIGMALHHERPVTIRTASWYPKGQATFSDTLTVRRHGRDGLDNREMPACPSLLGNLRATTKLPEK